MRDSEIEDLLRRYQPAGPPAGLKARIFAPVRLPRAWPWAAAAAALLVFTIGLHAATTRLVSGQALEAAYGRPTLDDIAAALGGGDEARRMAELILLEQQARAEVMPAPALDAVVLAGDVQ